MTSSRMLMMMKRIRSIEKSISIDIFIYFYSCNVLPLVRVNLHHSFVSFRHNDTYLDSVPVPSSHVAHNTGRRLLHWGHT